MPDVGSWLHAPEFWVLVGFHVFLALVMALDLGVVQRQAHVVSTREALVGSLVWIGLALLFAVGLAQTWHHWHPDEPDQGTVKAIEFSTGYLIELSLSVDNLFVFLVIFRYFAVPEPFRHRVLTWGIVGAVVARATCILLGTALLYFFRWAIYFFGVFLIYTGYQLSRPLAEEIDPGNNAVLRLARRLLPIVDHEDRPRFWVYRNGRWRATPLILVVLVVESTDVLFAIDSIPAIFGVTRDPFLVYTSNIFAVIGLRSLYFLLARFLGMFRFLNVGLAIVLVFIGIKMIAEEWLQLEARFGVDKKYTILLSLGVVASILSLSVLASVVAGPAQPLPPAPGSHA